MPTTFFNSLDSDASSDFTYFVTGVTVTYPGEGIRLNTGGAGDYTLGIITTAARWGVPGMYFEWYTTRASAGNTYAFSGIRKTPTLDATGTFGVVWVNANLETTLNSTAVGSANDTWFKIKLVLKDDDTIDIYVDDVFIENANPGVPLIGYPLWLQLAGAYYSPVVGYKDVSLYDPRGIVDSSDFSDSTGWTTEDSGGAANFTGNTCFQEKSASDGWGDCGVYRTAPTTLQKGDIVRVHNHPNWSSQPECFIWLRFAGGVNVSTGLEGTGFYFHQSAAVDYITRQNATSLTDSLVAADTDFDLVYTVTQNGYIHMWYSVTGDEDWQHIGVHETDRSGTDFYFATTIWANLSRIVLSEFSWEQLPAVTSGDDDEAEMSDQVINHFLNKLRR